MRRVLFLCLLSLLPLTSLRAQYARTDTTYAKSWVGSTMFLLGNFAQENKPDFFQLNFGHRITHRDAVSMELITWKYRWPLGIPYGHQKWYAPDEEFPGYIREAGVAFAYQRFWWKGLYTGIHVFNSRQSFFDEKGDLIKRGYQMFNTYRVGCHIKLFKDRCFIEPSIAITHRTIHSKMPAGFAEKDDRWSKFFFGEPGLHFGFNL